MLWVPVWSQKGPRYRRSKKKFETPETHFPLNDKMIATKMTAVKKTAVSKASDQRNPSYKHVTATDQW